ncbi:hypothetical protein FEM48_Zijuj01G0079900 [Ziziphus jujuba var. spinosa]|uniref:Polygalacturonase-like n=1 Tax=Ziziphus jujuba var. spinosa TaxID=714518 RepID=A0A978W025_ZIZJJ|nr:hypothetical protein FEM48_Zijuj01G0079900 [Ziziphus jujuba var. spinosa]
MGLRFINFPTICFIFLLSFKVVNGDPADGVFNVKDFGALANGKNDDAKVAFLSASTKACNSNIAAKVLVPEGTYLVSLAKFQGPCKAPTVFEVHGVVNALPRLELVDKENWIAFQYLINFTLPRAGVFHGQGATAWSQNTCSKNSNCKLPIIKSIKISAPAENLNTDGIHIGNSNGIEISSSVIGTGDDCVSLGQGSKNINIFDVFCGPAHGISVGSLGKTLNDEMVGLTVRNCTFTGTDNGVRIKTWPDCADGIASDFVFDDIVMNNVQNPIVTDQQYCAHNKCNLKVPSRIKASNVSFKRIRGISAS